MQDFFPFFSDYHKNGANWRHIGTSFETERLMKSCCQMSQSCEMTSSKWLSAITHDIIDGDFQCVISTESVIIHVIIYLNLIMFIWWRLWNDKVCIIAF